VVGLCLEWGSCSLVKTDLKWSFSVFALSFICILLFEFNVGMPRFFLFNERSETLMVCGEAFTYDVIGGAV